MIMVYNFFVQQIINSGNQIINFNCKKNSSQKLVSSSIMKNTFTNKCLPLTIKQLKKAQHDLKSRKSQTYDGTTYEFITVVARVGKISGIDIRLSDQTQHLDIVMYVCPLKTAAQLVVGKYYRFKLEARKNILKGGNTDSFGFEIIGISKIRSNEITIHLMQCLQQKLKRQQVKAQQKIVNVPNPQNIIQQIGHNKQTYQNKATNNSNGGAVINSNPSSSSISTSKIQAQIAQYFTKMGAGVGIEGQKLKSHFNSKYLPKEIERVVYNLCDKGLIMDLGDVYEWVGEE